MILRTLDKNEYKIITGIHLEAFSNFFLTSLGIRFLNAYYKAALKSTESISICAVDEDAIIRGFGIGCVKSKGFHKRLIKSNFFSFFYQGIIVLFSKPASLKRLMKNLDKNSSVKDDGNYAELLSIAVSPTFKGSGLGRELIKEFEDEAKKRGCKKIALTTDYFNNQNVLSFYEKSGYVIYNEFITYPERRMYKLIKDINK